MNAPNNAVILIVDDRPHNIKLLFNFLKDYGYKVLIANDGTSALEKLTQINPDLILLDVMMPGIDGFETCRQIKASPKTCEIPVIFMTALSEPVDKLKGFSVGAVDYIIKPFEQEEVLARLQLHLKLRSLANTLEAQNTLLRQEIEARSAAELALHQLTMELEDRVVERTNALCQTSRELRQAQLQLLQREEKLKYDAFHDQLTQLPNRSWLMLRLEEVIQFTIQHPQYLYALLFIDIDRFKVVNDSLGHLIGDELLKGAATRLHNCLRQTDTIARFGGDEFVILLEDLHSPQEAIRVAERIQEQIRLPFKLNEHDVFTGVSIGITLSTIGYQRPEDVLRDADVAMYQAKAKGKGRYEILTNTMQTIALSRLQLETDLRRALEQEELSLYYQPIVSLSTGEIKGFEALLRWHHPIKGWISPVEFIPVAEETGIINAIGVWVFEEACRQLYQWQQLLSDRSSLIVNVNVSAMQLKQVNLLERLEKLLEEFESCRGYLKLEITESCILETMDWEEQMLRQIKELGIQLCIDDFGTGYSSLSRLHELPIDTLKIDRSFVNRIGAEAGEIEIVQTIVTLAHSLRMDVVAEGIETNIQLDKLRSLGYDLSGQGYLFSPPVDSQRATQLLFAPQEFQSALPIKPQRKPKSRRFHLRSRSGNCPLRVSGRE